MEEKKNEIILFENQGVKLEVNLKDETVWLTQAQMEELFDVKHATISEHISNIFKEGELEERTSVGISDKSTGGRKSKIYNLDVIISVGYRVKSKNGVIFRKWATKILKDYMLKGYAVNQKRLEYLEKTIKLIDIANRMEERLENNDAKGILRVIGDYSKALDLLDDYDHRTLKKIDGNLEINLNNIFAETYYENKKLNHKPIEEQREKLEKVAYPCKEFWKIASEYNINVVYGIDAHHRGQI